MNLPASFGIPSIRRARRRSPHEPYPALQQGADVCETSCGTACYARTAGVFTGYVRTSCGVAHFAAASRRSSWMTSRRSFSCLRRFQASDHAEVAASYGPLRAWTSRHRRSWVALSSSNSASVTGSPFGKWCHDFGRGLWVTPPERCRHLVLGFSHRPCGFRAIRA